MENGGYLLAGFAVVWAVVFAYVVALNNRQKRVRRDLELMKGAAKQKESV